MEHVIINNEIILDEITFIGKAYPNGYLVITLNDISKIPDYGSVEILRDDRVIVYERARFNFIVGDATNETILYIVKEDEDNE